MILKKEFYFVRHGQTDHNLIEAKEKKDHPHDIPLNQNGRNQAKAIEPIIASLPVQVVCTSPMKRAQETKEIITAKLPAAHHQIDDLSECTGLIWKEMSKLGMYSPLPKDGEVRLFMDRIRKGINAALSIPGIPLIVAHGGVHWAACCLMALDEHMWAIDNCTIVHFSISDRGKWTASCL